MTILSKSNAKYTKEVRFFLVNFNLIKNDLLQLFFSSLFSSISSGVVQWALFLWTRKSRTHSVRSGKTQTFKIINQHIPHQIKMIFTKTKTTKTTTRRETKESVRSPLMHTPTTEEQELTSSASSPATDQQTSEDIHNCQDTKCT